MLKLMDIFNLYTIRYFEWALFLACIGAIICIIFIRNHKDFSFILPFFLISFVFRILLVALNENLHIFQPKVAGNISLGIYCALVEWLKSQGGSFPLIHDTFVLQTLINAPGFFLFGASRNNLLITNAFIGALVGVISFFYLNKLFDRKTAKYGFMLFSIYPAAICFSIFGLRGIMIYFFITLNIFSFITTIVDKNLGKKIINFIVFIVSLACVFSLRPELLVIIIIPPIAVLLRNYLLKIKRERHFKKRLLWIGVLVVLITTVIAPSSIFIYNKAVDDISEKTSYSTPSELISEFTVRRYMRHKRGGDDDFGGRSHILPKDIYLNVGLLPRLFLQMVGMIIVPFPWLLTNFSRFLAFGDSIFVFFCIFWTYKGIKMKGPRLKQRLNLLLLLSFFFGIVVMGCIVTNAGNAFRMRLAIMPYLLTASAIYLGRNKLSNEKKDE